MAYSDSSYRRQIDTKLEDDLKLKKAELPAFCKTFFNSTDTSISIRTKISYAMDMRVFFKWVIQSNPAYSKYEMPDAVLFCARFPEALPVLLSVLKSVYCSIP